MAKGRTVQVVQQWSQGSVLAQALTNANIHHGMTAAGVTAPNMRFDREGVVYFCEVPKVTAKSVSGRHDGKPMPNSVVLVQKDLVAPPAGWYTGTFDVTNINGAIQITNLTWEPERVVENDI